MSKIEEALKKAVEQRKIQKGDVIERQRNGGEKVVETGFEKTVSQHHRLSELLHAPSIKIDNLLLATVGDEKTQVVEEYNKLRSTIIALTKGDNFSNTIMVTSTASEEGKSMTALNLAISLAREHDYTVLLVDTDLRRPAIHKFLGLNPDVGLVHCLRDALIKTGIGKLVVLPAGEAVKDPVDMLSSSRMKEIVLELKERYAERYVIFDTPPALPFADAGVLAAYIDATLFVVREGRARREDLIKTLEEMKSHNLLGIVYNDAHGYMKKHEYYYY